MLIKNWFSLLALSILFLLGTSLNTVQAQQAVTIALPPFLEAIIDEAIVAEFETQNGVQVEFIYDLDIPNSNNAPKTTDDIEAYSEDLQAYMSSADVLIVDQFLTPEVTRAGYALDLTPLISADSFLNPSDFYSAVWESFMWDGGMWALPVASQPLLVDFNIEAFDEAGLSYPNQSWLLDDFAFAVRELTQYDENGEVSLPGMVVSNIERDALFRAILGAGFYDFNSFPDTPNLDNPQLADLIDLWTELVADGVVQVGGFGGQADDIPIVLSSGGSFSFTILDDDGNETDAGNFQGDTPERGLAPLPNGDAVLLSIGLAVSSGTSNPDLAYSLVRYLSEQQTFADAIIGAEPARNIYFTEAETTGNFQISFGDDRTEDELALVNDALENGLPTAELRFYPYLSSAIDKVQAGTDSVSALEEAELEGLETVQAMDDLNVSFTVVSGLPIEVAEGEVILNFGFQSFITPLPNEAEWNEAIATFVANDPDVGAVNLDLINIAQSILGGGSPDTYDCTYYSSTFFIDLDTELLLALDPLLFSDLNYNVNDLPFGALELLQLNGVAYGLPIVIQPQMLQYDPEIFALAGVPEPIGGWSITEFGNALELLDLVLEEDESAFTAQGFDNSYLLMLMAAQGGLPIDTRTTPPTIDYTSPESLNALQNILDWVDAGYINQGDTSGIFGGGGGDDDDDGATAIVPTFFAGFGDPELSYTTYPTGTSYTPVAFDVGAGYISIDTALPEACFRWLSYISTQPELFIGGMPAQLSLLDSPRVQDALGTETAAAYRTIAEMMASPNVVNFNATDPFLSTWLQEAINAYLNEDADLLTELEDAQLYTLDYIDCSSGIELELSIQTFQALNQCVEDVNSARLD